jgi:hypothetical protein
MRNEQIISKGIYGFSQIGGFISVKNYIFMHQGDNICLAIRFSNDTDYVFDSMSFCIVQLDALGEVIGKTKIEYTDMDFEPDTTYVSDSAVIVDSKCVDFKLQIYEAYSGFYKYVPRNRRVVIYYDRSRAEAETAEHASTPHTETSVKRKNIGKPRLTVLAAVLAMLIMLGFTIYYLFSLYLDTFPEDQLPFAAEQSSVNLNEDLCLGVEYAEI